MTEPAVPLVRLRRMLVSELEGLLDRTDNPETQSRIRLELAKRYDRIPINLHRVTEPKGNTQR